MGEKVIDKLLEMFPKIGLTVLFVIALVVLLREYRSLRQEMGKAVQAAVDAHLASILGNVHLESAKARKTMALTRELQEKARMFSEQFEKWIAQKEAAVTKSIATVEERLKHLDAAVSAEHKYPTSYLVTLARGSHSQAEALAIVEKVQSDPDATSSDLEEAGDIAWERFGRWSLARPIPLRTPFLVEKIRLSMVSSASAGSEPGEGTRPAPEAPVVSRPAS